VPRKKSANVLLNEQCIVEIKAAIKRKSIVVITGTGVSVQSVKNRKVDGFDVVTWTGLLLHGIDRCEGLRLIKAKRAVQLRARLRMKEVVELIQVAEIITATLKTYGKGEYQRWLSDAFSKLKVGSPRLINALSRIASIYATLNYDSLAEKQLGRAEVTWKQEFKVDRAIDGLTVEAGGKDLDPILHLHGHWSAADSVVFGTKSYEEVVQHAHAQAVQRVFAAGKTMLLVGCGGTMTDPNFKQFFDDCGKILTATGRQHFVLCRKGEENTYFAKIPWLRPVIYGENYTDLAPFVERLFEGGGEAAGEHVLLAPTPPSDSTVGEEWLKDTLKINPDLMAALLLTHRQTARDGLEKVASGNTTVLGLQTRFPRSVITFVAAYLADRKLLDKPEVRRWVIVRDATSWQRAASRTDRKLVLVAHPTLAFEANRADLSPLAQKNGHAVIYPTLLGRTDDPNVVPLKEPSPHEVNEILEQHGIARSRAQQLATQSNGNLPLLLRELAGTHERPAWAKEDLASQLRPLALLGGWKTNNPGDVEAISTLIGTDYDTWLTSLLPVFLGEEPPFVRTINEITAVSRYENWQLLGPRLTDQDLERFAQVAKEVLCSNDAKFDIPEAKRAFAGLRGPTKTYSGVLRRGIAETVALISGKPEVLSGCSPGKGREIAYLVVHGVLAKTDWKRWASLGSLLSLLAEADPDTYLKIIEADLFKPDVSAMKDLFDEVEGGIFGGFYQSGLLWSLEVLAWNTEHLNRVVLALADLDQFPLPENMMNRPLNSLRSIFLAWLPQTTADVAGRRTAISAIINEYPSVAWKLLLELLPATHSVGSYNPRPVWRDWVPADFRDRPSPQDQESQFRSYAELAMEMAVQDLNRLQELLDYVAKLPPAVFSAVLDGLEKGPVSQIPERQRLPLWQKLIREAQRHRRFADTNWALSAPDVAKIEQAAETISPKSPEVRNQYWFNFHDHDLFGSDDYEADIKKVAAEREKALAEVLNKVGVEGVLKFAEEVAHPDDVGIALGLMPNDQFDSVLLPSKLDAPNAKIAPLAAAYVRARYWKIGAKWLNRLSLKDWSPEQLGSFFSKLTFQRDVWEAAEKALGERAGEYWKHIDAFPRGDPADILAGLTKLVQYRRGASALHAVNNLIRSKTAVPAQLAMDAVLAYLADVAKTGRLDAHELVNVVKTLQTDPDADKAQLEAIEWHLLPLFDRHDGSSAVVLEKRLSTEPDFFVEQLKKCYRANDEPEDDADLDPALKDAAQKMHRLLHGWHSPPGVNAGVVDAAILNEWVNKVRDQCIALRRWEIAQLHIGYVLVYAPSDPTGLWMHRAVAGLLNTKGYEDMRRGFATELFNRRGGHFSDGGKAEREIAASYKKKGKELDRAGFSRIAATVNGLAETYVVQAEREEKQVRPGD
jgi:hypothetical protein